MRHARIYTPPRYKSIRVSNYNHNRIKILEEKYNLSFDDLLLITKRLTLSLDVEGRQFYEEDF